MDLDTLVWIIAGVVLVFIVAGFVVLFAVLVKYKNRIVLNGLEDEKISKNIDRDVEKFEKSKHEEGLEAYRTYYQKKKGSDRVGDILNDIFLGFLSFLLVAAMVLGLYMKFDDNKLPLGNTTYLVVQNATMEKVDSSNTYLSNGKADYEYIDTRIDQYSLIGLDKYVSSDQIKLYDIVAYKYEDDVIVHRVIGISKNDDGIAYTLRGDANSSSLSYELSVTESMILGVYNGFDSPYLGIYIVFIQSWLGIILICLIVFMIISFMVISTKLENAKTRRYEKLIDIRLGLVEDDVSRVVVRYEKADMIAEEYLEHVDTQESCDEPIVEDNPDETTKLTEEDIVYFARQQKIRRS